MYPLHLLALVTAAVAVPLNINLGAYSPALVVGDGAIGFEGGREGVNGVVNALQGAAVAGAAVAPANAVAPVEATLLSEPVRNPPRLVGPGFAWKVNTDG